MSQNKIIMKINILQSRGEFTFNYSCKEKAMKAAAKRSLFAKLNGKFSQYDAIEKSGKFFVVQAGKYPEPPFTIIRQYCEGYSQ